MKTSRAIRISTVLKVIALVMAFAFVVLLSACDETNAERTIVNAGVKNVPEVLYVSELDSEMRNVCEAVNESGIMLFVEYDDGTYVETPFDFNMLDEVFKQQLNTEGTHSVVYMYKGQRTEFDITVEISTTYKVCFYNKSGKVISEQRIAKGAAAQAPSASSMAVEGYDFISWSQSFDKVTSNLDIHPVYTAKTYVVNFYDNNGNLLNSQTVTYGGSAVEPAAPTIEGYDFVRWDKSFSGVKADVNVKPVYEAKTYTVRFLDGFGNVIDEQTVRHGNAAVEPTNTKIDGYRFVGWDRAFDNVTENIDVVAIYEGEIAVRFYNCNNELIAIKYVSAGGTAQEPTEAERFVPGWYFVSWDSELTNIQKDTDVYGIYFMDKTTDTDGDGLTDYLEINTFGYDYSKVDSDGNGIADGDEDFDKDGLSNVYEIAAKLDPANADTDGDGLSDGDEINIYWTLPAVADTDGDGANDGWEIFNGFDPCVYNASFKVEVEVAMPDNTQIKVDIPDLPGEYVGTTIIEQSENSAIQDVHGSIGAPIKYNVSASASITLVSDEAAKAEDPVLMYFNTKTNQVEPIEVSVSGNEVTANITEYGSYVLVDRKVFEEKGQWRDVFDSGKYSSIEIVFVVDDSGSMSSNDGSYKRLSVAIDLINNLPADAKVGVVLFDSSVQALTSSLTTKDIAKGYLTRTYFNNSGNTKLYSGAKVGLDLMSSKQEGDGVMRIIVLLSDGQPSSDSYTQANIISMANAKGAKIYTVGLGNSTSAFNSCLKPLSEGTDGQYYHSSNASELQKIYDNIGETIDMSADDDGDGISNFFESGVDKNGVPTLPTINGMDFMGLDKNNPDTDGDGYLDGQEIEVYLYYSTTKPGQVMVWGIVNSNPLDPQSVPAAQ